MTEKSVDKKVVLQNIRAIRERFPDKRFCFVVKANAYGHGTEIAKITESAVDAFAVSSAKEGEALRKVTDKPVLLLFFDPQEAEKVIKSKLTPAIYRNDQLVALAHYVDVRDYPKHLKIDTGMHRYGVKTASEFRSLVKRCGRFDGVFSHYASPTTVDEQRKKFFEITGNYLPSGCSLHIGATSSLNVLGANDGFNAIRVGLGCYGFGTKGVEPAMRITTMVNDVFKIKAGQKVGYDGAFSPSEDCKVAIIGAGYGDGLTRDFVGREVGINGKRYPVVASCMDCSFVKADGKVKSGDVVTLLGKDESGVVGECGFVYQKSITLGNMVR